MTPTKLLIGPILVVFAIVIAGIRFATEWCTSELGFQAELGISWCILRGFPFYRSWHLFAWWFWYDGNVAILCLEDRLGGRETSNANKSGSPHGALIATHTGIDGCIDRESVGDDRCNFGPREHAINFDLRTSSVRSHKASR